MQVGSMPTVIIIRTMNFPPIAGISVTLRHAKPTSVMLEPAHKKIPFDYSNGQLIIHVPPVNVHSILVID